MSTIEEKRVYGDRDGATTAYVATGLGVVAASIADDRLGEFGIVRRCEARDAAADSGRVAVATAEDVLRRDPETDGFEATGFGPAVAVGFDGGRLAMAGEDGRLVHEIDGERREIGSVDASVRAVDGDLVATDRGVYRVVGGEVESAGLDDAHDVSTTGTPLAATGRGLYRLGNGWMDVLDGEFRAVGATADGPSDSVGRAHAATPDAACARTDGEWTTVDLPVDEAVVDFAYGKGAYGVTAAGTLLVNAGDGWRAHPLGVRDAAAIAVP